MSNITQISDLNFNETLALTPEKCKNLCLEEAETRDYCANLWKEMEFENHLKIVITLAILFVLSTIEGLLDGYFSWTPYNMVHDYVLPENDENNENVVPLVEKGLTDLSKTGGALAPPPPLPPAQPLATALPKTDENNENNKNDENGDNDENLKLNIQST